MKRYHKGYRRPLRLDQREVETVPLNLRIDAILDALDALNTQRKRTYPWRDFAEVALYALVVPQVSMNTLTLSNDDVQELGATRRQAETLLTKLKEIGVLVPLGTGSREIGTDEDGRSLRRRGYTYYTVGKEWLEPSAPRTAEEARYIGLATLETIGVSNPIERNEKWHVALELHRTRTNRARLKPVEALDGLRIYLDETRPGWLGRLQYPGWWGTRPQDSRLLGGAS